MEFINKMNKDFCPNCQNLISIDPPSIQEKDGKKYLVYVCRICEKKIERKIDKNMEDIVMDYSQEGTKNDIMILYEDYAFRINAIKKPIYENFPLKTSCKCGGKIGVKIMHLEQLKNINLCKDCGDIC